MTLLWWVQALVALVVRRKVKVAEWRWNGATHYLWWEPHPWSRRQRRTWKGGQRWGYLDHWWFR